MPHRHEHIRRVRHENLLVVAGVMLILVGLIAGLSQTALGGTVLLVLFGLAFVGWGIAVARVGPLVLGAMMTGTAVGTLIAQLDTAVPARWSAGIVVLCLGIGIMAITPLALAFAHCLRFWPVILGGVVTLIGVGLMIGGVALSVLQFLGTFWPAVLVLLGVYLLVVEAHRRSTQPPIKQ